MNLTTNSQRILHQLFLQEYRESGGTDEAHFFEFFASQQVIKDYDLSDEDYSCDKQSDEYSKVISTCK